MIPAGLVILAALLLVPALQRLRRQARRTRAENAYWDAYVRPPLYDWAADPEWGDQA